MKNRIKFVRESLGLTLEAFGSRIGVTRSAISNIENGRREPTNQLVASICREFHVSEEWIRTGSGDPFPPKSRAQEIADYANAMLEDSPMSARSIIISYIMSLDVEDWEAISGIVKKHGLPWKKTGEDSKEPAP